MFQKATPVSNFTPKKNKCLHLLSNKSGRLPKAILSINCGLKKLTATPRDSYPNRSNSHRFVLVIGVSFLSPAEKPTDFTTRATPRKCFTLGTTVLRSQQLKAQKLKDLGKETPQKNSS